MSWFSSWSDFTTKASEAAKTASLKASEAAKKAATASKEIAAQVNVKVNKFVEEHKKEFDAVEEETDLTRRKKQKHEQMMQSGLPPWYIDEQLNTTELQPELKLNILKLSEDTKNFRTKAPSSSSVFQFNLDYALPHAQRALAEDPALPSIRFKLVPKELSEEQFWKNYFYRVNVIRESLGIHKLDLKTAPIYTSSASNLSTKELTDAQEAAHSDDKDDVEAQEQANDAKDTKDDDVVDEDGTGSNSKTKIEEAAPLQSQKSQTADESDHHSTATTTPKESDIKVTEIPSDADNDIDANVLEADHDHESEEFLSDDVHIGALTDEQKAKMKQELGIGAHADAATESIDVDNDNVDEMLAGVATEDVEELSDGELAKELENM